MVSLAPLLAQESTRAAKIQAAREKKAQALTEETISKAERTFLRIEKGEIGGRLLGNVPGFNIKVGGIGRGQGFAIGPQYKYDRLANGQLEFRTSARLSTRLAQLYDIEFSAPKLAGDRVNLSFLTMYRNQPQVDYYGPGPDTLPDDRTSYRYETTDVTGRAAVRPVKWVEFGGQAGLLNVNVGPGKRSGSPSADAVFTPLIAPGIQQQTDFVRAGGWLQLDFRNRPQGATSGTSLLAEFTNFADQDLGRHDFQQLRLEAEQYIPFWNKRRVIALRGRTVMSYTDDGQSVPFYLQPWLGGPDTIRGVRQYRFYGDNHILLNAEYRWDVFEGLGMALFFDAGKVTQRKADLDLSGMETAAGIGFRFNQQGATFLRFDAAVTGESLRLWIRFGPAF